MLEEEFRKHGIHEHLDEAIEAVSTTTVDDDDEHFVEYKTNLLNRLIALKSYIASLSPAVVSSAKMNEINNQLISGNGATAQVRQHKKRINLNVLRGMYTSLDTLIVQTSQLAIPESKDSADREAQELSVAYADLFEQAETRVQKLKVAIATTKDEVSAIQAEIATFQNDGTSAIQEVTESVKATAEQSSMRIDALVAEAERKLELTESTFSSELDTFMSERTAHMTQSIKELNDKSTATLDRITADIKSLEHDTTKELTSLLSDSRKKHEDIIALYNLVAGDSVAGDYLNIFVKQGNSANRWRFFSIFVLGLTVVWLILSYTISDSLLGGLGTGFPRLLGSAAVTGVLVTAFTYSSRQSNYHRMKEQEARRLSVLLKAFDPFISSLTQEEQRAIRSALASKLFDPHAPDRVVLKDDEAPYGGLMSLMQSALKQQS